MSFVEFSYESVFAYDFDQLYNCGFNEDMEDSKTLIKSKKICPHTK